MQQTQHLKLRLEKQSDKLNQMLKTVVQLEPKDACLDVTSQVQSLCAANIANLRIATTFGSNYGRMP